MDIKTKIYATLVVWLGVCAGMYFYGFGILQSANRDALSVISEKKDQLLSLQAEQQSYRLAQQDLDDLGKKDYQPGNFFSRDISLVKELSTLENLSTTTQVRLTISGINGTIDTLPKAKTQSPLYTMSYYMNVSGPFINVYNFIQSLYNLNFVTTINTLSMGGGSGNVVVTMSAYLYIQK